MLAQTSLPLSQVDSGKKVLIKNYAEVSCRSILMGIGILPEDVIEVVRCSFLGSPIYFKNQYGLFFSLRKFEAEKIEVELQSP